MARVTVEDCVDKVSNRFELVLLAAQRARVISAGNEIFVERDNDKNTVVALREIADTVVEPETLRADIITTLQHKTSIVEAAEEALSAPPSRDLSMESMNEEAILAALQAMDSSRPGEHSTERVPEPPKDKSSKAGLSE